MSLSARFRLGSTLLCLCLSTARGRDDPPLKALGMTRAIACASITGLDDYVALRDAVVTPDDKLLFYYKPLGYRVEKEGDEYRARLSVDGTLRRKGAKKIISRKVDVIKYEPKKPTSTMYLYFSHVLSVKGLPPGEYELEITLHDRLTPDSAATQRVPFRVEAKKADSSAKTAP